MAAENKLATEKQMKYAKKIAERLGIDPPKSQGSYEVSKFIRTHREEMEQGKASGEQLKLAGKMASALQINMPEEQNFKTVSQFIQDHLETYNQAVRDHIVDRVKITDYAEDLGYGLMKRGRFFCLKEYHSVVIDPEKNMYRCYSMPGVGNAPCEGGTVIDFAVNYGGMDVREAIKTLSERVDLDEVGSSETVLKKYAVAYLKMPYEKNKDFAGLFQRAKKAVKVVSAKDEIIAMKEVQDALLKNKQIPVMINIVSSDAGNLSPDELRTKTEKLFQKSALESTFRFWNEGGYDRYIESIKDKLGLRLPDQAPNMHRVFAYLTKSRCIEPEIVQDFVKREMLYQDNKGNCVFVSSEKGTPVFACLRGTNTYKRFVADVENNDYAKGFYVANGVDKLIITESVIDAMSVMSALKMNGIDYKQYDYLPLAGAAKHDCVLNRIRGSNIKEVYLALDNDKGGRTNAASLEALLRKECAGIRVNQCFPGTKDWNEELKAGFSAHKVDIFDFLEVPVNTQLKNYVEEHQAMLKEQQSGRIPLVLNAYGGPGSGKTTACMEICAKLKKLGYNAEYVQEYAKDLVYDKKFSLLDGTQEHQFEILKEQTHRIDRLYGQTDFIVTDSPVLLNLIYNQELTPEYAAGVNDLYNQYENFSFFIRRDENSFQKEGRIHDFEQSKEKDMQIKQLLKDTGTFYSSYNHQTVEKVIPNAIAVFKRVNPDNGSLQRTITAEALQTDGTGNHIEKYMQREAARQSNLIGKSGLVQNRSLNMTM